MSALPKPVQQQVDAANAIIEDINKPPEGEDAENTPPVSAEDAENTPPVEPANEPANPPAEPAAAEPPADPPAEPDPDHKYKVLQGKYNAEVPRLQAQVKEANDLIGELRQRLNNTEGLLAALHTAPAEPAPAAPAPTAPGISEEERAQFGPDLIDVIERVAEAKLMPVVTEQLGSVDSRFQKVEQSTSQAAEVMARSERDKVIQALAAAVPDWEKQNENKEFLSWLNENDAYAGRPRGQLLTEAYQSHDVVRVIAIFKGFQTENAVVNPSGPTPEPAAPTPEPQASLEDYVAPGTPKTGTTSAPNESGKRVWTRKDVAAFYAKKNEFVISGKPIPDEYVKLEKDLIKAQGEGRLR